MTDDDKAQNWCSPELPCARYEALSAKEERLREVLESVLPSLEHYYQIAIENGHPEFIEAAMLALHTAYAALGDEA